MTEVVRPVKIAPGRADFPAVDLTTGCYTPQELKRQYLMWLKLGGFDDDFFSILTAANTGTIQGLIATGQNEALARALGDVSIQGRLQSIDKIAAQLEGLERRFNALQGISTSALVPQIRTRVVIFDADDTYRAGTDVKTIEVYLVGGGGGGGRGAVAGGPGLGAGGGGGGGGGYSYAAFSAGNLPDSVAVTVGAGGAPGLIANGGDGGDSAFGFFILAQGGHGGLQGGPASGIAGLGSGNAGSLFAGSDGGRGTATAGLSAPNDQRGAPGGGGGGGNASVGGDGAAGIWRTVSTLGDGGAGGAGGVNGSPGSSRDDSDVYLGPGYGGGGGGGGDDAGGDGGNGGDGIAGSGAGGGGRAGLGGSPGVGGTGGHGRVWIVEHL